VGSDWNNDPDAVLQGLWGNLVSAASEGRSATNMWDALRTGAYNWAESLLNVTSATTPTADEIQAAADNIIGHVTVQDMNKYVQAAGDLLSAKAALMAATPLQQIEGNMIFSNELIQGSINPAVPSRYEFRVLRTLVFHGFTDVERQEWATYEMGGPLTNAYTMLNQANLLFNQAEYNSRVDIFSIDEYEIRQKT